MKTKKPLILAIISGWGIAPEELPALAIGEESPVNKKYAPIPTTKIIRIIKIQIQAEPLLFFIILN